MQGHRRLILLAASAPCWLVGAAHAEPSSLELSYSAPAECPGADALREAVGKLVTQQPSKPLVVRVTIALDGARYVASIAPSDGSERQLSGATCAEVVEAVSVVLALATNPRSSQAEAAEPAEPAPAPAPPTPASSSPPPAPAQPPAPPAPPAPLTTPARSRREPLKLVTGAAFVSDLGALPPPAFGVAARAGLASGAWSASGAGTYFFTRHGTLASDSGKGGDFSLWSAAGLGCGALYRRALRVELCAGAEVGHIQGQGFGLPPGANKRVGSVWAALLAGPELAFSVAEPLRLRLGLAAAVPMAGRHPFTLEGNTVHQPEPVTLRSTLGVEVVF
jgi:hypothetical protein